MIKHLLDKVEILIIQDKITQACIEICEEIRLENFKYVFDQILLKEETGLGYNMLCIRKNLIGSMVEQLQTRLSNEEYEVLDPVIEVLKIAC